MVREIVKKAFRVVVPYDLYWIYRAAENLPQIPTPPGVAITPVDTEQVKASPHAAINGLVGYGGPESAGFGAWADGKLVAVCWFWWGDRYRTRGNLWPIGSNASKLVQITTDPDFRGRGIAPALITAGVHAIRERGFTEVYARIWHSNRASLHAFQKGGWLRLAFAARIWGVPFRAKWLAHRSLMVD
jgi:ribosomal protein S18 acetylase RimI-like enzyme